MAHEISQPLSSATNYLHAATRLLRAQPHADPAVTDALVKAQTEAQRARETLERVRDYVSSGRLDLTSVELTALTARIVSLIRAEAASRGVEVAVSHSPHLPTIRGDAIQLEQLLLNLLSNAIDAAANSVEAHGRSLSTSTSTKIASSSPSKTMAQASPHILPTGCLSRAKPPSKPAWGSD